jgi:hypothetical protein
MDPQEPQIIDLDPDKAPRTTAIILLLCGLMGIGFLLVNVFFTGEDQYYMQDDGNEWIDPGNQRFDIMPNLLRGKHVEDSEEDDEANEFTKKKPAVKKPAVTRPSGNPFQINSPSTPAASTTQRSPLGR